MKYRLAFLAASVVLANFVPSRLLAQGVITTVAGNGLNKNNGDGGPATNALILNSTTVICRDASGNIYFDDHRAIKFGTSIIRMVDATTGNVSTLIDSALMPAPSSVTGMCVDNSGNLLLSIGTVIWKRLASTGNMIAIAGHQYSGGYGGDNGPATAANLIGPYGIDVDIHGNIYIADGDRIRKIDAATGIITLIGGGGTSLGDGNIATSARIGYGSDLKVDAAGNIFIADTRQYRLRKIDALTSIISTVAGNGIDSFSGDGTAGTNASIGWTSNIALDPSGNVYLSENTDPYRAGLPGRIRKLDVVTGIINTISGNGTSIHDNISASAAAISPIGICSDHLGNLYFNDATDRIRTINAGSSLITSIAGNGDNYGGEGTAAIAAFIKPQYNCTDLNGNIYFTEVGRIRKIDGSTGILSTVGGIGIPCFAGDGGPATDARIIANAGLCTDASNNIYFIDGYQGTRVRKIDAVTGIISTIAGGEWHGIYGDGGPATAAQLIYGTGVTVDGVGNVYIAMNDRIRKIDNAGIISTITSVPVYANQLAGDATGNIYFTESDRNYVKKIDPTGNITIIAGTGYGSGQGFGGYICDGGPGNAFNSELNLPVGLAVNAQGDVFFADARNNRVRVVNATNGNIYTIAGTGYGWQYLIGWHCADPILSDYTGGFTGDNGHAPNAELYYPSGLSPDGAGNLYITDQMNYRIRKVGGTTAVPEVSPTVTFSIVPNPSTGFVAMNMSDSYKQADITVCNAIGQRVFEMKATGLHSQMDLSGQPTGMYIVSVKTETNTSTQKLIINR